MVLVVKYGSKILPTWSLDIPIPLSKTDIKILLLLIFKLTLTDGFGIFSTASTEFLIRLLKHWLSWNLSNWK